MKDFIISPLYDFVFKEVFGKKKNIEITKAFLKTILDIPEDDYDKLSIGSPSLGRRFLKDKEGIVDVLLTTKSGKIIHIELQVEKVPNMKSRILYYGARLIGDQLNWGDDYNELHHAVSIVICDHILLKNESSYINVYELRNENNNIFTDKLRVVIIELPKLPKTEDRALWPWLRFFKCEKKEDFEMLSKKHPEVKEAVKTVKYMSLTKQLRYMILNYNLGKIAERDIRNQMKKDAREEGLAEGRAEGLAEGRSEGLAEGRAEGRAEGLTEGHAEAQFEIARRMKELGDSDERVHAITNLPLETIKSL
jgi:predicted transposase/invertase (TIGR01784 family)